MSQQRRKVILDHDGGVDDLVALAILAAAYETVELIGVVGIDADCFIEPATQVAGKVLSGMQAHGGPEMARLGQVPVGRSTLTGVHPFPNEWRADAIKMNDMPCVNTPKVLAAWEANHKHEVPEAGEELMARLVMSAGTAADPVDICVTGPLSNVAYCLGKYGNSFAEKVGRVVIMGGAVDVKGNVYCTPLGQAGAVAEWNIYWDAPSAKAVLASPDIEVVLFSLDATNHVPVESPFVQKFGALNHRFLGQFIGSSWATCTFFSAVFGADHSYYAWDALTAAWLVDPPLVNILESVPITVITEGVEEGQTKRVAEGASNKITVAKHIESERFYTLMLALADRV